MKDKRTYTAFVGENLLASGELDEVLPALKSQFDRDRGTIFLTFDDETGKEVDSLFREIGLDQPSAQKLMDFYIAKSNEAAEAPFNLWTETQKQWVDEIKADPVIGKRLPEVKATVSRAIDGLGDPKLAAEFRQAMDITGAGNNPAFVRAFYRLAQQVTEGHHVSGKGPSEAGQQAPDAKPRTAATTLYPNLPS